MADDDNKCGHDGCVCAVGKDSSYCSQHCEDAEGADVMELMCECGHPGCGLS